MSKKYRVFNLGFMAITDTHIDCLSRAGFEISESYKKNVLPMINMCEDSISVSIMVKETIKALDVKETDIFIISGVPDVGYYVVQALLEKAAGEFIPFVLIPLGRHIAGAFRVAGFRQVMVEGFEGKPFHFIDN